ncbi:unnamed protein product [Closterium sp. NIES-64]|nr:unnamed protein product [Closterium sp. NIES-64]CAI5981100.1 unnamed protein product [Closterium sp. NIES-65]
MEASTRAALSHALHPTTLVSAPNLRRSVHVAAAPQPLPPLVASRSSRSSRYSRKSSKSMMPVSPGPGIAAVAGKKKRLSRNRAASPPPQAIVSDQFAVSEETGISTDAHAHAAAAAAEAGAKVEQVYEEVDGHMVPARMLTFTIVGASGDLARKKIFPALFALYYEGCLPEHFQIFGYARSKMDDAQLRELISSTLTCRIDKSDDCGDKMDFFLERCFYHSGQYDSEDNFAGLDARMKKLEAGYIADRMFYLAIPPNVFVPAARSVSLAASSESGYTRVIVEKPFGRDSESSALLTKQLGQHFTEDQIYRIDHYLGKELVENLLVLRFSNLVFEPLWSRQYIRNVQIIFSEDFGTEGRGGYFDHYGIIRDIMQNHLLQILTLFAMEPPVSLSADDIINEKVKVLRSMRQVKLEDAVVAQYKGHVSKSGCKYLGYTDDPTVPPNSITPTFAAAAMFVDNARWDGVPFLMKAGKALHDLRCEIRVQFRHVPGNLYQHNMFGVDVDMATNELVIRLQPNEAIYLKINNKVPGLDFRLDRSRLNLRYIDRYQHELPDAYERLLLDAMEGDKRLFIRSDELEAAWGIFTPLLQDLEKKHLAPELYPYGSRGPIGAHYLAAKHNVRWGDLS